MLGVYIVRYQGGPTTLYGEDVEWKTVILDLRDDFMNLSKNQDKVDSPIITLTPSGI